ncbi:MAG: hypothetical protein DWB44_15355 [Chloroflexi bacterium]|nr:hypothetical protein [Chloroflexota bacterium]
MIYEKRSLAYVRRILRAWKQSGRNGERKITPIRFEPNPVQQVETLDTATDIVWPPPSLVRDASVAPDRSDPAVCAWKAICDRLPLLGRLSRMATPVSLLDGVLTIEGLIRARIRSSRTRSGIWWRSRAARFLAAEDRLR